jgi:hypothetical protein
VEERKRGGECRERREVSSRVQGGQGVQGGQRRREFDKARTGAKTEEWLQERKRANETYMNLLCVSSVKVRRFCPLVE